MSVDVTRLLDQGTIPFIPMAPPGGSDLCREVSRGGTSEVLTETEPGTVETFAITPVARDRLLTLSRDELVAIAESAFGMWADRQDIGDTAEYVRSLRARWKKRLEDVESG